MAEWLLGVLVVIGVLIVVKMIHAFSILSVFPITQGAMFTSTARVKIRTFLDDVPMHPGDLLVDIGCGDGRVLREARKRYGVRGLGFEVNPLAYVLARVKSLGAGGVEIRWGNFWKADLRDAAVVFCYLFPDVMRRLSEKLKAELRPGATVVSCNFPLPGWSPSRVLRAASSLHNDPIYIYRIPESLPGRLPDGVKPKPRGPGAPSRE